MRLLQVDENGEFSLTDDLINSIPSYAILSHTWGEDREEVNFQDLTIGPRITKKGYKKLRFCAEQAARDGLLYFWVDTCCIDKSNSVELQEAITSMYRWYRNAMKCYVYLSDVSTNDHNQLDPSLRSWEAAFRNSRWFTRGWTLQELLAPSSVEFFCSKGNRLGDKQSLAQELHDITKIAIQALEGTPLSEFSIDERISWAKMRQTKREEDRAYSLLGIFDIHMPLIYGEGATNALNRLQKKIERSVRLSPAASQLDRLPHGIVSADISPSSFNAIPSLKPVGTQCAGQDSLIDALNRTLLFQESTPSEASTDCIRSASFSDDQLSRSLTTATDLSFSSSEALIASSSPENSIKIIIRVEVDGTGRHQEVVDASEHDAFQAVYEGIIRIRNVILQRESLEPVLHPVILMNSSISAFGAQDHTFPFNSTFLKAALEQLNDKHYTSVAIWAKFSRGTPSQSRSIVHQELLAKLETARVLGVNGGFVPLNRIKEILTADRIQQLFVEYYSYYHVPSQLCEIPEQVSQHAPRLLATIILACIENPVPTLVGFLEKGYSDSSMPLNYSELPSFCRRMDYDLICATQPQALVADISLCTNDLSIHTFSCQYRLPFIERSLIGEGAFGQVFKVKINTQDLDLWPLSSESFAIKQIHGHMEQDFLREFETLRALSSLKHPHLVDLLGAFKYCKKYHLVFPLASGSLHNFLIQYDPRSDRSLIPWIWGQLAGIADGLHHLHTGPDEQTTVKDPLPEKERPTLQEPQRDKFGYHHDIKPDNILCFPLKREGEEGRTVWKIADFGMARYHGSFNDQPHRYGTLSYIPPELDIRSQYPSPSSPYDIWSLGGMLSEVVAWILGGPREIGRFRTERKGYVFIKHNSVKLAAPFYYYERGKFSISPAVDRRLEAMINGAVEIFGRAGNEIADQIADLIKASLIIDPYQRPTARAVADRLNEISRLLEDIEGSDT